MCHDEVGVKPWEAISPWAITEVGGQPGVGPAGQDGKRILGVDLVNETESYPKKR